MSSFFSQDDMKKYMEQFKNNWSGFPNFPFDSEAFSKQINASIQNMMPDFMGGVEGQNDQSGGSNPSPGPTAQSASASSPGPRMAPRDIQVFETHDFVIARVPLTEGEENVPGILLDSRHLYLRNYPSAGQTAKLTLPAAIKTKIGKAALKNNVLEVRMVKRGPEPLTEISIDPK